MKVCLITATKDRHKQLERVVRFVLNQTYTDWVHLIYNNSAKLQRLNANLPTDKFILVNKSLDSKTGKPYTNLGDIYNDALQFVPDDVDIITFADDDDIYLPNHLEEGIKGLEKGGLKAYKPQKSWFKHGKKTALVENILEPSIFIKADHIHQYGFSAETTAQHHQWLRPLEAENQIFVDPEGVPTYICDWSQEISTYKTSGDPHNPNNFINYSAHTKDAGDGIITPCNQSWANHWCHIKPTK